MNTYYNIPSGNIRITSLLDGDSYKGSEKEKSIIGREFTVHTGNKAYLTPLVAEPNDPLFGYIFLIGFECETISQVKEEE